MVLDRRTLSDSGDDQWVGFDEEYCRFRSGDMSNDQVNDFFSRLIVQIRPLAGSIFLQMNVPPQDHQDLLQEVLLELLRTEGRFTHNLSGLVLQIAYNAVRTRSRKALAGKRDGRRTIELPSDYDPSSRIGDLSGSLLDELAEILAHPPDGLHATEEEVRTLRARIQGRSYTELAPADDREQDRLRKVFYRFVKRLRGFLQEEDSGMLPLRKSKPR